jgi:hypothetical protein
MTRDANIIRQLKGPVITGWDTTKARYWILVRRTWDDNGTWDDNSKWKDNGPTTN